MSIEVAQYNVSILSSNINQRIYKPADPENAWYYLCEPDVPEGFEGRVVAHEKEDTMSPFYGLVVPQNPQVRLMGVSGAEGLSDGQQEINNRLLRLGRGVTVTLEDIMSVRLKYNGRLNLVGHTSLPRHLGSSSLLLVAEDVPSNRVWPQEPDLPLKGRRGYGQGLLDYAE